MVHQGNLRASGEALWYSASLYFLADMPRRGGLSVMNFGGA